MSLNPLNFQRAEYGGEAVPLDHCAACGRWMADAFYSVNGAMVCTLCGERIQSHLPTESRGVFWRTVAVGAAVAAAASLGYLLLFRLVAMKGGGIGISFGAIGVGYVIAKAMQMTAKGAGGRKYQWAAALLSYAAITVAMTGGFVGLASDAVWSYPLFVLAPVFLALIGRYQMAGLELLFAWLGVRWAWGMLGGHGVKITGPFAVNAKLDAETLEA
jgi:hypothetical protein